MFGVRSFIAVSASERPRHGHQAGVAAPRTDDGQADRQAVNRRTREVDLRMAGQSALGAQAGDAIAQRIEHGQLLAAQRRGNGVVGRQRMVPSGNRCAMRPRASWRIRLAQLRSLSGIIGAHHQVLGDEKAKRGLRSSSQP